jgi:tRNA/rRNA methyltransferase
VVTPREAGAWLRREADSGLAVGLLYGGERAGLETADIAQTHGIVTIPIDPKFHSLNLAQAVAITAYEWRLTVSDAAPPKFRETEAPAPADQAAVQGFYEHLEGELETAGFFHPPEKKASMVRNLRVAFGRARLSDQEVRTLRGVVTALARGRGRVLAKLAAQKAAKDGAEEK